MNRKTSFKKKIIISVLGVAVVLVILSAHIVYFKEKLWFPMFWYKFENIVVD